MAKAKGKDAAKQAEKKARKAGKQEKKSSQKEKKISKKTKDDDSDAEDADLDAILAQYQKEQEQFLKVTETTCEPPSPRSSATLVASPSNTSEIFLFGGEYYNGALASFYSDLYIYKINQDAWRKVTSPNSPLPRSGHACVRAATQAASTFLAASSRPLSKARSITTTISGSLIRVRENGQSWKAKVVRLRGADTA